jgi:hypothetical protein
MPFLRVSRDRRGFEELAILHQDHRRGRARPSLLYWFRTPAGIRVGRRLLDEETRRRIESAHPEIIFDWSKLGGAASRAAPEQVPTAAGL